MARLTKTSRHLKTLRALKAKQWQTNARAVVGDKVILARLDRFEDVAQRRIIRKALYKVLGSVRQIIRSDIPPSQKSARKAIGTKVKQGPGGSVIAKVGGSVGKKQPALKKRTKPGVGISPTNVHWLLMGTAERFKDSTGAATGKMPKTPAVRDNAGRITSRVRNMMPFYMTREMDKEAKKIATFAAWLMGRP